MTNTSFRILNGSSDKHWLNKKNGYDKKKHYHLPYTCNTFLPHSILNINMFDTFI